MPAKQSKEPDPNFESAIGRLEQIVEEMESDKLPLEQLLVRYEEGTKLVKICQEKLDSAEKRIEIIARGPSGKLQAVEFQAGGAKAGNPPPSPSTTDSPEKPTNHPTSADEDDEEVTLF